MTDSYIKDRYFQNLHTISQISYMIWPHFYMISMSDYVSINIPPVLRNEADLYVQGGYFTDRSELIRAAIREYLDKLSDKRVEIAIQLYKEEKVSLGGAAQIANSSINEMRYILRSRGVELRLGPEDEEDALEEYEVAKEIL